MRTAAAEAPSLTIAPLPKRFFAYLIDGMITFIPAALLNLAINGEVIDLDGEVATENFLAGFVLAAAYNIGFLAVMSATPGKMLMGLYVGDVEGRRISVFQAAIRHVVSAAFFVDFVPGPWALYLSILIPLYSAFLVLKDSERRRSLHDHLAGTLVLVGKSPSKPS